MNRDEVLKAIKSMQNLNMVLSITESERNAVNLAITALQAQLNDGWISVEERLPEPEVEVFIQAVGSNGFKRYTTAMYEDGKMPTDDSMWVWYDTDFTYDEENDVYLIPEGWWEYRHYNPDDVYNCCVDDKVTHWMPLPQPPKDKQ